MKRCPVCGVVSENMVLHDTASCVESEQPVQLTQAEHDVMGRALRRSVTVVSPSDKEQRDDEIIQLRTSLSAAIERERLANMRADQAEEARDAAVSASGAIPDGYKLVCEKCGADQGDKCGWPSNCPVESSNQRKEQG